MFPKYLLPLFLLWLAACGGRTAVALSQPTPAPPTPALPAAPPTWEATHTPTPRIVPPLDGRLTADTTCNDLHYPTDPRSLVSGLDVFSPDGLRVAYTRTEEGQHALYLAQHTAEIFTIIAAPTADYAVGLPTWSPDGAWVAFTMYDWQAGGGTVYILGRDGEGLRPLADYDGFHHTLAWSPTGSHLAFSDAAPSHGDANIFTTTYHVLVIEPFGTATPQWAADGCAPEWK